MKCLFEDNSLSPDCYKIILETMAEAVCIIDRQGLIRFCNVAFMTLTKYPNQALIGKQCHEIMLCNCKGIDHCPIFKKGLLKSVECSIKKADNTIVPVLKNSSLLFNEHQEVMGAVQTLTDISMLKQTKEQISELQKTLREQWKLDNIIGRSQAMQDIFELIRLSAASHATILVTGETGTGKELAARAIHNQSTRRKQPFVKVNCSAIPENLLESELFGHVKGAFTNAFKDRPGRFELANRGTLFLDEIGEVTPLIQIKLLRFLQEKEYERVGEGITQKADVRIIAATHRDLRQMVREGTFREDLYYRLKVFPIHLPSLHSRREDIGLLVDHFITKFNRETGKNISGLSHEAALTLMDYNWPGNIRELENAIEHAFVTCKQQNIDLFDLPLEIRRVELQKHLTDPLPQGKQPDKGNYGSDHFKNISKTELIRLLEQYQGNKTRLARALGVDRTTIWRKMRKLNVS